MNHQWNPNLYYPLPVPPGNYNVYQNPPPPPYYTSPYSTPPPNFNLPPPNFLPNAGPTNFNVPPPNVNSYGPSQNYLNTNNLGISNSNNYRGEFEDIHNTPNNHYSYEGSYRNTSKYRRDSPSRSRTRSPNYRSKSPYRSSRYRDDKYRDRSRTRSRYRSKSPIRKSPSRNRIRSPKIVREENNSFSDERKQILQNWRKNYCSTKEEVTNKLEELNGFNQDEAIEKERNIWTRSTPADLFYERDETNPKVRHSLIAFIMKETKFKF